MWTIIAVAIVAATAAACEQATAPMSPKSPGRASHVEASTGYRCPTNWINYATIPGNIYPYHKTTVGTTGFYALPFQKIVGYSDTGLEKRQYKLINGKEWMSDDKKIIILNGLVEGWCYFIETSVDHIINYTGNLQVTGFSGDYLKVPDEETTSEPFNPCDDPMTPMVEECEGGDPPPSTVGTGGSYEGQVFHTDGTTEMTTPAHVVCYVTDWRQTSDGGQTWYYTDTTLDYCTIE